MIRMLGRNFTRSGFALGSRFRENFGGVGLARILCIWTLRSVRIYQSNFYLKFTNQTRNEQRSLELALHHLEDPLTLFNRYSPLRPTWRRSTLWRRLRGFASW